MVWSKDIFLHLITSSFEFLLPKRILKAFYNLKSWAEWGDTEGMIDHVEEYSMNQMKLVCM